MTLRLLACQILIPPVTCREETMAHVERVAEKIDSIVAKSPVDLIVLPELSTIDYSRDAFSRLSELAEPVEGPTRDIFGKLARRHGAHVVFGIPRVEDGAYYISQVVLGADGRLLGFYDKIHMAQFGASMEKEFFTRGRHLFVVDICGYRVAPIICYDIRIPELTRTLCMNNGAELILHCGAYARDESFYSWHHFAVTRAMENMVYLLGLNRAGALYGSSIFCGPWVDDKHPEVTFPMEESFRILDVDIETLTRMRASYPFLRDRLQSYGELELRESSRCEGSSRARR